MSADIVRLGAGPNSREGFAELPSGEHIQICRATVGEEDAAQHIVLFLPAPFADPLTLDSLTPALSREPAGTVGALLRASAEGRATVEVLGEHSSCARQVAAVAAVMRASWGWDESPTIVVTVNGTPLDVAPRCIGDRWTAAGIAPPAV
jgi:hypothetical protein